MRNEEDVLAGGERAEQGERGEHDKRRISLQNLRSRPILPGPHPTYLNSSIGTGHKTCVTCKWFARWKIESLRLKKEQQSSS